MTVFFTYPLASQDALDPDGAVQAARTLVPTDGGDVPRGTLSRLRSLEAQMRTDYPVAASEINSLRLLAESMVLHDGYNASVVDRAPVIELQRDYTTPTWRRDATEAVSIAGSILGSTAFLAGSALYAEALATDDEDAFNEVILPLTIGGGVAVLSTAIMILARTPQIDPLEATILLDPLASTGRAERVEELAQLRDRRAALEEDLRRAIDNAPAIRRGSWHALTTAIAGAAVTTTTLILGQVAYANYSDAQFTEDAVELRRRVEDLRTASTISATISAASFGLWQWARLQLERPRQILADLQQVDAALERERREIPEHQAP
jgi:hypothetical protein